jgi:hypothetical protein
LDQDGSSNRGLRQAGDWLKRSLIREEQDMPVQKEQKMLAARIIFAVMVLNLLFLLSELTMNVVRVYFG